MPELPEVETTVQGLNLVLPHQQITAMKIYDDRLRWPVDHAMVQTSQDKWIGRLTRRSKYILMPLYSDKDCSAEQCIGEIMIHLGMSGRLQVIPAGTAKEKHSHLDWHLQSGDILRFTDPRRFGSVLWVILGEIHPRLAKLGPEPLSRHFTGDYLYQRAIKRQQNIKVFIMNAEIVVGVGNIYASESLFRANIHPLTPASQLSLEQMKKLVAAIKITLKAAIKAGGTTLRDFKSSDGKPGYFKQKLQVYDRVGLDCYQCGSLVEQLKIGQRSSYFCAICQPLSR